MRLSFNICFWFVIFLFSGMGLYFTINVVDFKSSLSMKPGSIEIISGQEVIVNEIIDGDEVSVKLNNKVFIVRILGIKSFNPTVNDPVIQNFAKTTLRYLKNKLLNKNIKLVFDEIKFDSKKRLLSYLEINGSDIGKNMVKEGLTLVFNRYNFSRINEYLNEENKSIKTKQGLWNIPNLKKRSLRLKDLWEIEKLKEE